MADKLSWNNKPTSKIFGDIESPWFGVDSYSNIERTKYNAPKVNFIPRNMGSTDWILKAAILDERVMIICKDGRCKEELRMKYRDLRREFYRQLTGSEPPPLVDQTFPMFITISEYENKIRGHRVPIVFDNSCFF